MVDIGSISLECRVCLGRAELKGEEYSELRVGDVIVLEQGAEEALEFQVEGRHVFDVSAGLEGMRKAVVIRDERVDERRD